MPAVTVADITPLARIPAPAPTAVERPVVSVTEAQSGYEGEGFPVRRAAAGRRPGDLAGFGITEDGVARVALGIGWVCWRFYRGVAAFAESGTIRSDVGASPMNSDQVV